MTPWALLRTAWEETVVTHRGRTILTMTGVAVGVCAVTVVTAAGDLTVERVRYAVEQTVGKPATIRVSETALSGDVRPMSQQTAHFVTSRARAIGLQTASPEISISGLKVSQGRRQSEASLMGVSPSWQSIRSIQVVAGRWIQPSDSRLLGLPVLINQRLARTLGWNHAEKALAERLVVGLTSPASSWIVGVVDDGGDVNQMYTHDHAFARWVAPGAEQVSSTFLIRIDPRLVAEFGAALKSDFELVSPDALLEVVREDNASRLEAETRTLQIVLLAISGVVLFTGGLGALNTSLVTVRERVREFGIRRSFGATAGDIFRLVLVESVITTLLAAIVGVGVGILIAIHLVPEFGRSPLPSGYRPSLPYRGATAGFVAAILVGLIAGLVPARRASRLPVIRAIRE